MVWCFSKDYEKLIKKYLDRIKNNAKIYIFYFEGNDFKSLSISKQIQLMRIILYGGYKNKKMESKKDFLMKD